MSKKYDHSTEITWRQADYAKDNDIKENCFDAMFSFYAGFISQECKRHLRSGGILVANNSHGDASMAIADPDYISLGAIIRNGDRFRIKTEHIEDYYLKKDKSPIDTRKVKEKMIGEKFSKYAYAYIFRKV